MFVLFCCILCCLQFEMYLVYVSCCTICWVIRPVKTVGRITYIVLAQTLNPARSINPCLSVPVKWLAVKTASEMTWIVLDVALNSTPAGLPVPFGNGLFSIMLELSCHEFTQFTDVCALFHAILSRYSVVVHVTLFFCVYHLTSQYILLLCCVRHIH